MIVNAEVTLFGVEDSDPTRESVFGDPEYDPQEGVTVPANVSPIDATELEINRDTRLNRYAVVLELDAPIDGLTSIVWEGKTHTAQGEPKLFGNYRGRHHYEIEMRGLEG